MAYKSEDIVDKVLKSETALRLLEQSQQKEAQSAEASSEASAIPAEGKAEEPRQEAQPADQMPALETVMTELKVGDIVEGTAVEVRDNIVVVDVGAKSDGILPIEEFASPLHSGSSPAVQPGDKVSVFVTSVDDEHGSVRLSKKRADYEKTWKHILDAQRSGVLLNAVVTERVKGGIRVDLGVPGFVPASHSGFRNLNALDRIVGSTIKVKVIEADKKANKVILSRRQAQEEEKKEKKSKVFDTLQEGQIVKGTVRSLADYGAFVDVGGTDGLLHISEMSWARINHPSELLKVGAQIEVMVLKLDPQQGRISLGLRQITPDPWQEVARELKVGSTLRVKVSRLAPRAVFVRLPNLIEGIIPISELDIERVNNASSVVKADDEFEAQVINISVQERKITLSRRRVLEKQRSEKTFAYSSSGEAASLTLGDMYGDILRSHPATARREPQTSEEAVAETRNEDAASEEAPEARSPEPEARSGATPEAGEAEIAEPQVISSDDSGEDSETPPQETPEP